MESRPSPSDGRGSPPTGGHDPGLRYRDLQSWWRSGGVNGVLNDMRAYLCSPRGPGQSPVQEPLPRLSAYNAMVFGPSMSIQEELMLRKQLEFSLRQVQSAMKCMHLEPVQLSDLSIVQDSSSNSDVVAAQQRHKGGRPGLLGVLKDSVARLEPSSQLFGYYQAGQPVCKTDKEALYAEEEKKKQIQVIEKYSKQIKDSISMHVDNSAMSEECGRELCLLVDCMEKNLKLTIQSGGSMFSLHGLRSLIPEEVHELFRDVSDFSRDVSDFSRFAVQVMSFADRTIRSIGSSPVHFKLFGKEAKCLLQEDFTFEKLKLNSDLYNNLSVAIGGQKGDGQLISQLMFKIKEKNNSLSFNMSTTSYDPVGNAEAPGVVIQQDDDIAFSGRLSMSPLFGEELKSVFQLAYPSYLGKFEIRGLKPYLAYAGSLELRPNPVNIQLNPHPHPHPHPHPVLDISGVLGMKYVGVGGLLEYNFGVGSFDAALGMSMRTELAALGLSYKFRPGIFSATVFKKLVYTRTCLAADFSYTQEVGPNHGAGFTTGFKHSVDPSLYYKGKLGTAGASFLFKKSFFGAEDKWSCSIKGAAHVAFNDPWRVPKIGVTFSFRS